MALPALAEPAPDRNPDDYIAHSFGAASWRGYYIRDDGELEAVTPPCRSLEAVETRLAPLRGAARQARMLRGVAEALGADATGGAVAVRAVSDSHDEVWVYLHIPNARMRELVRDAAAMVLDGEGYVVLRDDGDRLLVAEVAS